MKVNRAMVTGPVRPAAGVERTYGEALLKIGRNAGRERVAETLIGKAVVAAAHPWCGSGNPHLCLTRQGEERAALAVDCSDGRGIDPMTDDAEEPDSFAAPRDCTDDSALAAAPGGERRDIDDRNLGIGGRGELAIRNEFIA